MWLIGIGELPNSLMPVADNNLSHYICTGYICLPTTCCSFKDWWKSCFWLGARVVGFFFSYVLRHKISPKQAVDVRREDFCQKPNSDSPCFLCKPKGRHTSTTIGRRENRVHQEHPESVFWYILMYCTFYSCIDTNSIHHGLILMLGCCVPALSNQSSWQKS